MKKIDSKRITYHIHTQMPYSKEYYDENREAILFKNKEYRATHASEIKERGKKYYEENKEKFIEQKRLWAKQKHNCECGACFRRDRLSEHLKLSVRHQLYLSSK